MLPLQEVSVLSMCALVLIMLLEDVSVLSVCAFRNLDEIQFVKLFVISAREQSS